MSENQVIRKMINDPDNLIAELIDGMVAAHPGMLRIEGETGRAIVAVDGPRHGKVGIVIGGGSGHEPAFAGYVGRGLADAAPLGNIFASPSPSQIMDAAFAADGGAGVVFLYGNYTGDVMNFDIASERLGEYDIQSLSVVTTDDVASAPKARAHERRGVAGNFFVFKATGAAADLNMSFDDVVLTAQHANAATYTMGVALSACAMPQTGLPNFQVPAGKMEIGMGIHGEPGIEQVPVGTADDIADALLDPILSEMDLKPEDEVAVLVNGLGSTTLLELYLLHRRVAQIMATKAVQIHKSWVGNYCTSLEMAGASVTLMKLDPELKRLLNHPCETPALSVGAVVQRQSASTRVPRTLAKKAERSRAAGVTLETSGPVTPQMFQQMLVAAGQAVTAQRDALSVLDGAIGDGDHGVTMEIGWKAAISAIETAQDGETISETCARIADSFLEAVGATVGPLYAAGFEQAAQAVSTRQNLDAGAMVAWLEGMVDGIQTRGGAKRGDKTMLDAWIPAAEAARAALTTGADAATCLSAAAKAASAGAADTQATQSRRGRSKKLGQRSIGHVDPGAASAAILINAMSAAFAKLSAPET